MKEIDKNGELLNQYQKERLADAETTLEINKEGANIDDRGITVQEQRKDMAESSMIDPTLGDSLEGKGGETIKDIDRGELIKDDFDNRIGG